MKRKILISFLSWFLRPAEKRNITILINNYFRSCNKKVKNKDKKLLIKILLHYRSIHRNGDLSKRHWKFLYEDLKEYIKTNQPNY